MDTRIYSAEDDRTAKNFAAAARKSGLNATQNGREVLVVTSQGLQRAALAALASRYGMLNRGTA